MKIDSVAALKRAIKPDTSIKVIEHWQPHLKGTTRHPLAVRKSGKRGIQTNGYYFAGTGQDGKACEMWAEIPKASELKFNGDNSVTFHPGTERSWTLAFEISQNC